MKHLRLVPFFVVLAAAPTAFAQKWEIGGGAGGSFYTSQTFKNALGSADAGLSNGVTASFWLDNNTSNLLGGEIRYDYEHTNLKLESSGTNATFGADTHALHYDFLFHFAPRESRIRPFVSAGGGVKLFRGTGKEQAFQPLSNIGLLSKTNELKGLVSAGAGIKFAIASNIQFRLEAHDSITPFPKNVIVPASGTQTSGWLQDFVVMAGLSFTF